MAISRLNLGTTNQVLVKAAAGQTTNLLELQNSSGTVVAGLNQDGVWSGTAEPGLVLLNTTSFSGVTATNFTSNFSATYDNYRIVYSLTLASAADVFIRLRSGSTDATGSDYVTNVVGVNAGSVLGGRATQAYWYCNNIATATEFACVYDLFNPFKAQVTNAIGQQYITTGSTLYYNSASNRHNLTTSYDGFTIYSSVNMTGSASLYGYNK